MGPGGEQAYTLTKGSGTYIYLSNFFTYFMNICKYKYHHIHTTRSVTDVGILHPYFLNVKQPSHIYIEGHTNYMLLMRIKGDATLMPASDHN